MFAICYITHCIHVCLELKFAKPNDSKQTTHGEMVSFSKGSEWQIKLSASSFFKSTVGCVNDYMRLVSACVGVSVHCTCALKSFLLDERYII